MRPSPIPVACAGKILCMPQYDYDLFTIGAGSGGVRASRFAASHGARVAVAEQQYLGGTCVNVGCIPKKLMSYAAHMHQEFDAAAGYGWTVGIRAFDWQALRAAKDREIARLNDVYRRLLSNSGVTLMAQRATLVDGHTVSVGGKHITARHILIATGGKPAMPDLPGIGHAISSDAFFAMPGLPARAVVAGGGYIAVELASILNGLGSQVTLLHRGDRLLRGMDAELGSVLAREMQKKGITIRLQTQVTSMAAGRSGTQVTLNDNRVLHTDCMLFATGRRANTDGLGLAQAGIEQTANGAIAVDADFRTNVASVLAIGDVIGDVNGRLQLTPVALAEGMQVAAQLFGKAVSADDNLYRHVPTAVFSHPNVATVGLSEEQARAQHAAVLIFKSEFKPLRHTLSGSDERVFMKLVVDAASDVVLGMHMVGAEAGEILQGFAAALQCGITKKMLDRTIGIHPTTAEEFVTMRQAL